MVRLLGLDLADLGPDDAAAYLSRRPAQARFAYMTTPNADHFVRLARDPELARIYQNAWLRLLDSRVVARAARLLGLDVPQVAPGSDVTARLLARHVGPEERVTIIGLDEAALPALVSRCGLRTPPAHYNPPMGFERDARAMRRTVDFVLAHPSRFVLLAVGSPRQERLAAAIAATGQATGLGLCIGASLDFLAGVATRAPCWMQRAGLEWLHRLAHDPVGKGRRYLLESTPIFALLAQQRRAVAGERAALAGLRAGGVAGVSPLAR